MSEKLAATISTGSMSSAGDSPVRTSASPATARALMASDLDYGASSIGWWAIYDPDSSSWRTSQRSLFVGSDAFLATWPAAGSMRNGRIYSRARWVQHTHDDDCSLWPTPTASMDGRGFGIPLHERSGRYKRSTVLRVQELVTSHGWRIHPNFTEALMGFPLGHSAIEPSATALLQTSQSGSDVG